MRTRADMVRGLTEARLIAVIRASRSEWVLPICQAVWAGGFRAVEITLTVPDALACVRQAKGMAGPGQYVGVGTVLDAAACRQSIEAGADFIVSPILRAELVTEAHRADRPVMLGAYTPTEAQAAWEAGTDFVKLFPADGLGPAYIKALRAPLPHLRIVPTGGVDLTTARAFLEAGCAALGVGSALLPTGAIQSGNWSELTRLAQAFVRVVSAAP